MWPEKVFFYVAGLGRIIGGKMAKETVCDRRTLLVSHITFLAFKNTAAFASQG